MYVPYGTQSPGTQQASLSKRVGYRYARRSFELYLLGGALLPHGCLARVSYGPRPSFVPGYKSTPTKQGDDDRSRLSLALSVPAGGGDAGAVHGRF